MQNVARYLEQNAERFVEDLKGLLRIPSVSADSAYQKEVQRAAQYVKSQLEAAELDGASYWRVLRQIILPAIKPVVAIAVLIRGLDLFRIFDIIWVLTEGGPGSMTETISLYTYVIGFRQFDTSYTAAVAFLVIAILTIIVTYGLRRVELVK